METERFSVPELLFFPTDIGLVQPGLPEAAAQSIATVEEALAEAAANLVVLTGGNTKFRNFKNRFTNELRKLIPNEHDLNVSLVKYFPNYCYEAILKEKSFRSV